MQGVLHRPHGDIGTKVAAAVLNDAASRLDLRIGHVPANPDIRIALVVLEADVEARLVALNQRFFEDQRLDLVFLDDEVNIADITAQMNSLEAVFGAGVEVAANPVAQLLRLADVNDLAPFVLHQVDAGLHRQVLENRFDVIRGLECHLGTVCMSLGMDVLIIPDCEGLGEIESRRPINEGCK